MHRKSVLEMLKNHSNPVHILDFEQKLSIKERSIREAIRLLKQDGEKFGFCISTIPKKGYLLEIQEPEKFTEYLKDIKHDTSTSKLKREFQIIYHLLQQEKYTTIQELSELLDVSRNTINADLKEVEQILLDQKLFLKSKSYYGLKIKGDEYSLRNAFNKFVINAPEYTENTIDFFRFIKQIDDQSLVDVVKEELKQHEISVSDDSFHSIIEHIKILIYRVDKKNFIKTLHEGYVEIPKTYFDVSESIIEWIEKVYSIKIPKTESLYLASQISGRTLIKEIPKQKQMNLKADIEKALICLDKEFLTEFSKDERLKNALLMHLYPLFVRIAYKVQLNNPLIDVLNSQYANVFLVAIRFTEYLNEIENIEISKDEFGYIALHFAGHLERKKYERLASIRNILLVSKMGRGNVLLNRHKLENIFLESNIEVIQEEELSIKSTQGADLILSTVDCDLREYNMPFLKIPEIIQDGDLNLIKDLALLRSSVSINDLSDSIILNLFDERFFKVIDEGDYMEEIASLSNKMILEGVADPSFTQIVLEREEKFSTIYTSGVAGPHGLLLNAIEQTLGVIIVRKNMCHLDKDVNIIFLINIQQGNLFLYREISRFIMAVMNDIKQIEAVKKCQTFEDYINWFKEIKY